MYECICRCSLITLDSVNVVLVTGILGLLMLSSKLASCILQNGNVCIIMSLPIIV